MASTIVNTSSQAVRRRLHRLQAPVEERCGHARYPGETASLRGMIKCELKKGHRGSHACYYDYNPTSVRYAWREKLLDPKGWIDIIEAVPLTTVVVGQRVYWKDPGDGVGSGYGTVVGVGSDPVEEDTVITLKMDDEGEAEVLVHELWKEESDAEREG